MIKHKIFLLLALSIGITGFAAKPQEGYLVFRNGGDTLRGKIKPSSFKDWRDFTFIYPDGEKVKYTPSQVKAIKIGVDEYVSEKLEKLDCEKNFTNDGYVLLKVLERGTINLYQLDYCASEGDFQDKKNRVSKKAECFSYFYCLKEGGNNYYQAFRKDHQMVIRPKQAHSTAQLAGYLKECKTISDNVLFEVVERKKIQLIVQKYNECSLIIPNKNDK